MDRDGSSQTPLLRHCRLVPGWTVFGPSCAWFTFPSFLRLSPSLSTSNIYRSETSNLQPLHWLVSRSRHRQIKVCWLFVAPAEFTLHLISDLKFRVLKPLNISHLSSLSPLKTLDIPADGMRTFYEETSSMRTLSENYFFSTSWGHILVGQRFTLPLAPPSLSFSFIPDLWRGPIPRYRGEAYLLTCSPVCFFRCSFPLRWSAELMDQWFQASIRCHRLQVPTSDLLS